MQFLEGRVEKELLRLTRLRAPLEAVGLIRSDGKVIELTNHSSTPEDHFEVKRKEVIEALSGEMDTMSVTFWHSHPAGGVGPSRTDMKQKSPFAHHLVVSLVDQEIVSSWY